VGEATKGITLATAAPWSAIWTALGVLSAAAASGCSGNQTPFESASATEREFAAAAATWDLNHDGDVTCDEWKQYVGGLFREADVNRDGALTREEFAVMGKRDRLFETIGFKYFDADSDGRITLAEIAERPNPAFTLLDANKDCVLTPEERRHAIARPGGKGGQKGIR
jgi:Ca2+-binding EF-hand superfamily protein